MSRVELVKTTFTLADYTRAVLVAWAREHGAYPSEGTCAVLWAQYALETGRGKACWNNNIGNVKHVEGDGHDYCELPNTWEIENGKRVVYQPPSPQTWFRAYASLEEAMEHHLAFLAKRYGNAWSAITSGDPVGFATQLKARGYFTAPLADYVHGLSSLVAEFKRSGAYTAALEALELPPTDPEHVQPRNPDTATDGIVDAVIAAYQQQDEGGDP